LVFASGAVKKMVLKTVEKTSLNQVAAGIKRAVELKIARPGMCALDFGGGRFHKGLDYLTLNGIDARIYDPYAHTFEENQNALIWCIKRGLADIVFMNNVLNDIFMYEERVEAIKLAWSHLKYNGTLIVSIYEGNKTGTSKGFQNNRKRDCYLGEILGCVKNIEFVKSVDNIYFFKKKEM